MRKTFILITLLSSYCFILQAQSTTQRQIDSQVEVIRQQNAWIIERIDPTELYGESYDGGGRITIFSDRESVKNIMLDVELSTGIQFVSVYFDQNWNPIKIIETEVMYESDKEGTFDATKSKVVFEGHIYVMNWENRKIETKVIGKRQMSERKLELSEYMDIIKMGLDKKAGFND